MNRLSSIVLTLLISLGIGSYGLAQQNTPISAEEIRQLVQRIESLEQTVQELRVQVQSQSAPQESPSNAQVTQAVQAIAPSPAQDTPKSDPGIKISGLGFGDFFWIAANHNEGLKDNNGFWFRRLYLTFDKAMTEQLDMRLRFEMNSTGNFTSDNRLEPFAKDAWARWKFTDQHQAYLGFTVSSRKAFWIFKGLGQQEIWAWLSGGVWEVNKRFVITSCSAMAQALEVR